MGRRRDLRHASRLRYSRCRAPPAACARGAKTLGSMTGRTACAGLSQGRHPHWRGRVDRIRRSSGTPRSGPRHRSVSWTDSALSPTAGSPLRTRLLWPERVRLYSAGHHRSGAGLRADRTSAWAVCSDHGNRGAARCRCRESIFEQLHRSGDGAPAVPSPIKRRDCRCSLTHSGMSRSRHLSMLAWPLGQQNQCSHRTQRHPTRMAAARADEHQQSAGSIGHCDGVERVRVQRQRFRRRRQLP